MLPNFDLVAVRVFTSAHFSPEASAALDIWKSQVERNPRLFLHLGRMKKTTRVYPMPSSSVISTESGSIKVLKYEEKGSDVALASHLVLDATKALASIYYLMTSDTDFEPVIKLLKEVLGVRVGVICPTKNFPKLFANLKPDDIRHVKLKNLKTFRVKKSEPLIS